ncbi:hypothetical protein LIER_37455 [Lithospermum erythrorhizon]|uniref:Uncharacterized protein n=1 Tax=Lithospermum erythrorhizon TaxID=34254 RepID=A0AAV3PMA9_LITER
MIQNLQHGKTAEDENKTSFELNDLKINIVNEYESLIMTISYETYYDDNLVSPDKCRPDSLEGAIEDDFLFDPGLQRSSSKSRNFLFSTGYPQRRRFWKTTHFLLQKWQWRRL